MGIVDTIRGRIIGMRTRSAGYDGMVEVLRDGAAANPRPDHAAYAASHAKLWETAGKPIFDAILGGVRPSPVLFSADQISALTPVSGKGPVASLREAAIDPDGRRRCILIALSDLMRNEPEAIEARLAAALPKAVASAVLPVVLETAEFRKGHIAATAAWRLGAARVRTAETLAYRVGIGAVAVDRGAEMMSALGKSDISAVEAWGRRLRAGDGFEDQIAMPAHDGAGPSPSF